MLPSAPRGLRVTLGVAKPPTMILVSALAAAAIVIIEVPIATAALVSSALLCSA